MEAVSEPAVRLFSSGLLSKWGFGDGDAPEEWLDYCDEHGLPYGDWRDGILPELVKRYLLPVLDQEVVITHIGTNHNPVRAQTVDGEDAERFWNVNDDDESRLTPECAEIPMTDVARVAAELRKDQP